MRSRDDMDPKLLELLQCIDWKLNFIIKILNSEQETAVFSRSAFIENLSATGMKCLTKESYSSKTKLEIQLILPIIPYSEMRITGEVIRCVPRKGNADSTPEFEVGMEFETIKESDREMIIRYVLNRQMELQREKLR
ncbi:MAG TPA: PilZ domain-containing protein [Nitrospiria bacterium]